MPNWKQAMVVSAGVAMALGANTAAQNATLTALDYIEIQQLVNRYAFAIDNCTNNGYDYADLYTPDGVFYWGVGSRKSVGREELAEAAGGGKNGCKKIESILTTAPGNGAPLGGVKAIAESGWFAARPSGTESIYKIYAESFRSAEHLHRIQAEAQTIVDAALAAAP